jgi:hypothetical protein
MSRCEDIVQSKEGKLFTNLTTVIVDITITTTLVRAAEHVDAVRLVVLRHEPQVACSLLQKVANSH